MSFSLLSGKGGNQNVKLNLSGDLTSSRTIASNDLSCSCGKSSASGATGSTRAKRTHRDYRPLPVPAASNASTFKNNTPVAQVKPWLKAIESIANKASASADHNTSRRGQLMPVGDAYNPKTTNNHLFLTQRKTS